MNRDGKNLHFSFEELFGEEEKNCSRQEDLFQYFQNGLSEEDRQRFERHLVSCSSCPGQLAELHEMAGATTSLVLDSAMAEKLLDENRKKIKGFLDETFGNEVSQRVRPEAPRSFFKSFTLPTYVNALVIALAVVLLYPAYQGFVLKSDVERLQNELNAEKSKPRVSLEELARIKNSYENQIQSMKGAQPAEAQPSLATAIVYAVREERSGESETIPLHFNRDQKTYNLVFSVPTGTGKTRVEIFDDQTSVWKQEIMTLPGADATSALIGVSLPAEYLKRSAYHLVISSIASHGTKPVGEFKLKITKD